MKFYKSILIIAIAIFSFSSLYAKGSWTIEGKEFSVDTLYRATVGPGTTEIELRIESVGAGANIVNNIFYTVTDLTNPNVEMRAAKGGNHVHMLEIVPEIAERMNKPGERYFAGVNADFFNMSYPYNICGSCVAGGYLTNFGSNSWAHIIFDEKGLPTFADNINLQNSGIVRLSDGRSLNFKLNINRGANELIIYTPQWQYGSNEVGYSGTNEWGTEVPVRPVGQNLLVGNTLQLEVTGDPEKGVGNMRIPSDGYVLSVHGDNQSFLSGLKKGDIVTATMSFSANGQSMKVKELLGGCPVILADGVVRPQSYAIDHLKNKEPRTAVGHNADKTKLYMAVVDGRNAGGSAGVTQPQLGAIMRYLGCSDAMNFDGGGSSTMYVDGIGIKNVPSSSSLDNRPEGTPRTVVNALFAVAVAPVDNVIASIEIRDKKVSLTAGESYTPVVYGYNQYGVMVSTDVTDYSILVPEEIGQVNGNVLTASDGKYSGLLTVVYKDLHYSIPIHINGGGDFVTTGINDITTDTDSNAEYYQLNGIKTASPVSGRITIKRNGNVVSKELNR